jgi:hypothetical protein
MWRSLTARQRVLAALLTVLVVAAGVYRWVHFGDVNRLRGGGSTIQIFTGETETFPTRAGVEADARNRARADGKLTRLSCQEAGNAWSCLAYFVGGLTVVYRGAWDEAEKTMDFSIEHYRATVHFKVPVGRPARQRETYDTGYIDRKPHH